MEREFGHITRFSRLPTAPQAGIVAALVLLNLWFWRVLSRLALPLHAQVQLGSAGVRIWCDVDIFKIQSDDLLSMAACCIFSSGTLQDST